MLGIIKIRLKGCNCKACRSHWHGHHYYQNSLRKDFTMRANRKLRKEGRKEAKSLGEYIAESPKGSYFD